MHDHAPDVLRLLEAGVCPGEAAVGGLEHTTARGDRVATIGLAGAEVEHVRVTRCDRDVAHRGDAVGVEDRTEGGAVVRGLPHATRCCGDEERLGRERDALHVRDAAAHVRGADVAPAQGVDRGLADGLGVKARGDGRETTHREDSMQSHGGSRAGVGRKWPTQSYDARAASVGRSAAPLRRRGQSPDWPWGVP